MNNYSLDILAHPDFVRLSSILSRLQSPESSWIPKTHRVLQRYWVSKSNCSFLEPSGYQYGLKEGSWNTSQLNWIRVNCQYLCLFADSSSSFSLMQHLPRKRSRKPRRFQNKRPSSPLPFHLQLRTSAISAVHIFRCCHKHRLVPSEEAPVRVAVPCQPSSWADRLRGSLLSSVSPSVLKIHCRSQVTRVSTQTYDWLGVLFTEIFFLRDLVLAK